MPPSTAGIAAAAAASPAFPKPCRLKWLPKLSLHLRHHAGTTRAAHPKSPPPGTEAAAASACSGGGGAVGNSGSAHGFSEVFRRFDVDGDGKISGAELLSFLTSAGEEVSAEHVEGVVEDLDSDGDGLLDYGDFVRLMGSRGGGSDEDLRAAFEMFAPGEGSRGCITAAGLRRALGRLGEARTHEECAAMIRAFDADGNGVLDYQEFRRMMTT